MKPRQPSRSAHSVESPALEFTMLSIFHVQSKHLATASTRSICATFVCWRIPIFKIESSLRSSDKCGKDSGYSESLPLVSLIRSSYVFSAQETTMTQCQILDTTELKPILKIRLSTLVETGATVLPPKSARISPKSDKPFASRS